jgi:hypothetical protein
MMVVIFGNIVRGLSMANEVDLMRHEDEKGIKAVTEMEIYIKAANTYSTDIARMHQYFKSKMAINLELHSVLL